MPRSVSRRDKRSRAKSNPRTPRGAKARDGPLSGKRALLQGVPHGCTRGAMKFGPGPWSLLGRVISGGGDLHHTTDATFQRNLARGNQPKLCRKQLGRRRVPQRPGRQRLPRRPPGRATGIPAHRYSPRLPRMGTLPPQGLALAPDPPGIPPSRHVEEDAVSRSAPGRK